MDYRENRCRSLQDIREMRNRCATKWSGLRSPDRRAGCRRTGYCLKSGDVSLDPITRWHAYGRGTPMSQIVIEETAALPWRGEIRVQAI